MDVSITQKETKPWAARFFTIWTAQAFSLLGSQLVSFAVIWWLTKTTGSATVLATASLVGLLPQVVLGPFTGALVDRWSRKLVMIFADGLIALATVILVILFATGVVQIWHVYALLFVRALCGGFHWPAMQASTTLMVPKEHLSRIQGLNQMLQGGMNIASAPLGALLLAWLPMEGILAIDVVTAIIAITPLFFFRVPQPVWVTVQAEGQPKVSYWRDMKAGFTYVWGWRGLMLIGVMATVINFLITPAFSLLPILVTKHFNGQAIQLATLESFSGIGFIVGGLILSAWGGFKRRVMTSLIGLIAMGIGCLVMGLLPASAFTIAVFTMFYLGVINPIVNGPLLAAVQVAVAPEMQGRVFTLIMSVSGAMSPIGLIIAGPIADKLGVQSWFIIGGIVTGVMGIGSLFVPAIMNFENRRTTDTPVMHEGFAIKKRNSKEGKDTMNSQIAQTSKGPIEYTLIGNGPTVLVCHGTSSNCFATEVTTPLVQAGFSVLTPSRPGYGRTPLSVGRTAVQAAEALITLLDSLSIHKCSVIAISGGGPTGIALAAGFPQRVSHLVLAEAISFPENRLNEPSYKSQMAFYGPMHIVIWGMLGVMSRISPRSMARQTLIIFSTHNPYDGLSKLTPSDIECISRFYRGHSSRQGALNDALHTVGADVLEQVHQPTLVIHSREDNSVPFAHAEWTLRQIPKAELCEAGVTGHFFWVGPDFHRISQCMVEYLQ